jgi:hypothetical protein
MREAAKRKEERVHILRQEQMREVTWHPRITEKARRLTGRSHEARISWKNDKDAKIYSLKVE